MKKYFQMQAGDLQLTALLTPEDGPAVTVSNPDGQGEITLVCEHASAVVPLALDDLGLSPEASCSHIAWDPGALEVAKRMSAKLDAPLVFSGFSRLVYDCNRPPESPDAAPDRSEIYDVPGNQGLSAEAFGQRVAEIYQPFHDAVADIVARRSPVLVTVHSFTPVYFGQQRSVELGILHDRDSRLADAMLAQASAYPDIEMARNQPYGPEDAVTHTLQTHAQPHGLLNVMLEIRNDLIADAAGQERFATLLCAMLDEALRNIPHPNASGESA